MQRAKWYKWQDDKTLSINVRIQARASNDEIAGLYGDQLKIRITAPPVEGKANAHLIGFLSKCFGVPKSNITLIKGTTGRDKQLLIHSPRILPESLIPPC